MCHGSEMNVLKFGVKVQHMLEPSLHRQRHTVLDVSCRVTPKLHYTDTGYVHHQRTSSQQFFYNLLYYKVTTNGQKFATSQQRDVGLWHCDVANLL